MKFLAVTSLSFVFFTAACAAAPRRLASPLLAGEGGRARTVMVQLFEWPWDAVADECENVLGPAGFAAVQVSPPQEHIVAPNAPWWERYQPVSYNLISRSGDEAGFTDMAKRCARAGVDVYADVVLNHMSGQLTGNAVGFGGTAYSHYQYGGLWSYSDFHHCGRNGDDGIRNFSDLFELQNCELLGMADLNTGSPAVQSKEAGYLNHLLDLGVRGFRVDAAKHMTPEDLRAIFARVDRDNYRVLELILSPGEPVSAGDYVSIGGLNNFAYAYEVGAAFRSGDLSSLPRLGGQTGIDTNHAVVFVENHDLERRPGGDTLLSLHQDPVLHRLGLTFLLTWPYGYPAVYSGYAFSNNDAGPPLDGRGRILSPIAGNGACRDPFTCEHRAGWVQRLVGFHNQTNDTFEATNIWANGPVFAFGRGSSGHVVISVDRNPRSLDVPTQLAPGRYCNQAADNPNADCANVDANHVLHVQLAPRSAFVAE